MPTQSPLRRRRPKLATPDSGDRADEQYLSRSIGRALDVLECFPGGSSAFSLTELAQIISMPESSLFRILVTLESRGYLTQEKDGTYSLAKKVLNGRLWERAQTMRELLKPEMLRLARRFNETTSLAFLFEDRISVLESIESLHDIRAINKVGRLLPPYASSMGKAITAFQDPGLTERILGSYGIFQRTVHTVTDHNKIYSDFESIRRAGYACDRGEATEGGICIGAPIFLDKDRVEAAVSISVPLIRIDEAREREIIAELIRATAEMSTTLQKKISLHGAPPKV
jgi:DNA-binding IclR family transcriptional regulator